MAASTAPSSNAHVFETRHALGAAPNAAEPASLPVIASGLALVLARYGTSGSVALRRGDGSSVPISIPTAADADSQVIDDLLEAPTDDDSSVAIDLALDFGERRGRAQIEFDLVGSAGETSLRARTSHSPPELARIERLMQHVDVVLNAAGKGSRLPFGGIDLLGAPDRRRLLEDWNPDPVRYPTETLHQLFVLQAARTPEAVALVDGDHVTTYHELDRLSNRIARQLRPFVAEAGDVIAVAAPRSAATIAVKIGVMKAGAAFLYLDPSMPAVRKGALCRIAEPVVTVAFRAAPLPGPAPSLAVEDLLARPGVDDGPVDEIADDRTAAYILFTSGSTGEPKGVIRPHGMNTSRIHLEQRMYGLESGDRHLLKAVPFFREVFWALATGGTLVVARPGGEQDDTYLIDLIRRQAITVCSFVPSMLRVLLANPAFTSAPLPIRHLFVGGEVFDTDLERRLRDAGLAVHVTYTLAEADYVCHRGHPVDDPDEHAAVVGRPLDMRVYICDPAGRLRPPGVPGEILTGGPGLADGYVNRPGLTAERFIPNPIDPDVMPVVFRTGDLGRFRLDGQVEYIGRIDAQVKVRGQRVEPTEVEHVIRTHPHVDNVVVASVPDPHQGHLLVAYVATSRELDPQELRARLDDELPAYMVPSYIVPVAELPRLQSGKVDRATLQSTLRSRPSELGPPATPGSGLEGAIAAVWARVLGLDEVGVEDDFNAAGGDSLRAMLLRLALEDELGIPITLSLVVESPTIREQALAIEEPR